MAKTFIYYYFIAMLDAIIDVHPAWHYNRDDFVYSTSIVFRLDYESTIDQMWSKCRKCFYLLRINQLLEYLLLLQI